MGVYVVQSRPLHKKARVFCSVPLAFARPLGEVVLAEVCVLQRPSSLALGPRSSLRFVAAPIVSLRSR